MFFTVLCYLWEAGVNTELLLSGLTFSHGGCHTAGLLSVWVCIFVGERWTKLILLVLLVVKVAVGTMKGRENEWNIWKKTLQRTDREWENEDEIGKENWGRRRSCWKIGSRKNGKAIEEVGKGNVKAEIRKNRVWVGERNGSNEELLNYSNSEKKN